MAATISHQSQLIALGGGHSALVLQQNALRVFSFTRAEPPFLNDFGVIIFLLYFIISANSQAKLAVDEENVVNIDLVCVVEGQSLCSEIFSISRILLIASTIFNFSKEIYIYLSTCKLSIYLGIF
jgi:hypothetical protein